MELREKPIRVMLVDDHQAMLWGLDKLIQGEHPRMAVIGAATNGIDALVQAGRLQPDVILLNFGLAKNSGFDILTDLRAISPAHVLLLAGEREPATLDLAILHGARGVLNKDASAQQVIKAIEKIHDGELWLDHRTVSRVLGEMLRPPPGQAVDPERQKKSSLTARERRIVRTVVQERGASNKAMAQRLFISEHTLRNHLSSIYHKLAVTNRLELYVYALKHQLDGPRSDCEGPGRSGALPARPPSSP